MHLVMRGNLRHRLLPADRPGSPLIPLSENRSHLCYSGRYKAASAGARGGAMTMLFATVLMQ
jgi:hypothetical protein